MTKEELNAALDLQRKIDRLEAQLKDLQETGGMGAVQNSNTPVMGGGGSVCPGQLAIENEQEIKELKSQQMIERAIIQRFIDKQELDEISYKLLNYRYVDCMKWDDVAIWLGYHKHHLYKLHTGAIKNLLPNAT